MKKIKISQNRINLLNFSIAAVAILIAVPGSINQINQFFKDRSEGQTTKTVIYAPPHITQSVAADPTGSCWASLTSDRADAYRCMSRNLIYDPCFTTNSVGASQAYTLYCPYQLTVSNQDKIMSVSVTGLDRSINQKRVSSPSLKATQNISTWPWLIYLSDGSFCRLESGAVDIAYGSQGDVYACKTKAYASVTGVPNIVNNKYYFECKKSSSTYFEACAASSVVY